MQALDVLYVEDDARDADLTQRFLARQASHVHLDIATTLADARKHLDAGRHYDALLTDVNLPDGSGFELLANVRDRTMPIAVIVITGTDGGDEAVAALKAGADDFLVKRGDYVERLPHLIASAVERFRAEVGRRTRTLRVLYAEDDVRDVDLTRRHLARHAPHIRLEAVASLDTLMLRLPANPDQPCPYDVLLLDHHMAEADALEVLKVLRDERKLDLPVILVTGMGDGEIASQALRFGAAHYLVKHEGYLFELSALIEAAHDRAELNRERLALRASEAFSRSVLDSLTANIAILDRHGRIVAVNESWRRFALDNGGSQTAADPIGVDYVAICETATKSAADDVPQLAARSILAILDGSSPGACLEYPCNSPTESFWYQLNVAPMPGPQGRAVVAHENITERKLTERALVVLSTRLQNTHGSIYFEEAAVKIAELLEVECGFVGRLKSGGERRIRTLRICRDGKSVAPVEYVLDGTPCENVIAGKSYTFVDGLTRRYPAFVLTHASGLDNYAAVPLFDSSGRTVGHIGIMSRMPMRHPERVARLLGLFANSVATEIERQESEVRFKDLFEFSPDAHLIFDADGHVVRANQRALDMFGYVRDELNACPLERLLPEGQRDSHARLRRDFVAAPSPRAMGARSGALFALRKDGTTFPVDISLTPLKSDAGMMVVAAVRDITGRLEAEARRKDLEARLLRSQKMEAIGKLAGGIAHDFNNVLASIIGNLGLVRHDLGSGHPAHHGLDQIDKASHHALALVKQILTFSRGQAQERKAMSLRKCVEETASLLRPILPVNVTLNLSLDPAMPDIVGNATQVQQIIMNLCTNAWQAMEGAAGSVDLHTETVEITAGAHDMPCHLAIGRYACVSVADNGKGIDAAVRERIFEPFFTTKQAGSGTGLGLAVVHGIVEGHEGAIQVQSEPGRGTLFRVWLPAASAAMASVSQPKPVANPAPTGRHVLYVDDDEPLRVLVPRLLGRQGYRTTTFESPLEALEAIRANPTAFDVVVTDYNMPGMSGLDVAEEVARMRPDLPVAVISGYISETLEQEAAARGIRYLLHKPGTVEKLCDSITTLMAEWHSNSQRS